MTVDSDCPNASRSSRREFLRALSAWTSVAVAGCTGRFERAPAAADSSPTGTTTTTTTAVCDAGTVPKPTSAGTDPREYPERPARLTGARVREFVAAYETAFQYNRALADHPRKFGRLNGLSVSVAETRVVVETESETRRFSVEVSGQLNTSIGGESDLDSNADDSTAVAPETPTVTPLPSGHYPFETSYLVTDRFLRRESVTVACW